MTKASTVGSVMEHASLLPSEGRLMGLDLGSKTFGLSLSDDLQMVASPFEVLRRKHLVHDLAELQKYTTQHRVQAIIIGWPLNMDGTEGQAARDVRAMSPRIAQAVHVPILWWDERLSTVAAERVLIAADRSRAKRRKVIDSVAAAYILQGALDWLRTHRARSHS